MDFKHYSQQAAEGLLKAEEIAQKYHHSPLTPLHLLDGLLQIPPNQFLQLLDFLEISTETLLQHIEEKLQSLPTHQTSPQKARFSHELLSILRQAHRSAQIKTKPLITTQQLLLALLDADDNEAAQLLATFDINSLTARRTFLQLEQNDLLHPEQPLTPQNPSSQIPPQKQYNPQPPTKKMKKEHPPPNEPHTTQDDPLTRYTQDLTQLARRGKLDPVIGRDDEIRRLMQILSRRYKNNPLLIGPAGIGKRSILHALALRIANDDVPDYLKQKQLLFLDFAALIAGAKFRGEFEERFKQLLHHIQQSHGHIILLLPDLHLMLGSGAGQGGINAANLLKPALLQGTLQAIGTSSPQDYRLNIEKDPSLNRLFQPLFIDEPSTQETIAILRGLKKHYENHHGIRISDNAIHAAVKLSQRYIPSRTLPDKAIDLIDEAASQMRLAIESMPPKLDDLKRQLIQLKIEEQTLLKDKEASSQLLSLQNKIQTTSQQFESLKKQWLLEKKLIADRKILKNQLEKYTLEEQKAERNEDFEKAAELRYEIILDLERKLKELEKQLPPTNKRLLKEKITEMEISQVVADWTGIPSTKLLETEREKLLSMHQRLAQRVIGQEKAIEALCAAVRRSRSGLADPNKPIGSFLFLGPTGVGKTELAKALAEFLFDDEQAIIRLDMSEFMEKHTVARLLGSPPGYAGHEEGGQLTEAVRRHPYSVLLFDEMEKAHHDIFNILLQLLDDGRLTDSHGNTVNFKNTVIIMTSNIGAQHILQQDLTEDSLQKNIEQELHSHFRPEFLNRIDEILIFNKLSLETLRIITKIQLQRLQQLLLEQHLQLTFDENAIDCLAQKGYQPAFGARPLKRTILNEITNPLSLAILQQKFPPHTTIQLQCHERKILFKTLIKSTNSDLTPPSQEHEDD